MRFHVASSRAHESPNPLYLFFFLVFVLGDSFLVDGPRRRTEAVYWSVHVNPLTEQKEEGNKGVDITPPLLSEMEFPNTTVHLLDYLHF